MDNGSRNGIDFEVIDETARNDVCGPIANEKTKTDKYRDTELKYLSVQRHVPPVKIRRGGGKTSTRSSKTSVETAAIQAKSLPYEIFGYWI